VVFGGLDPDLEFVSPLLKIGHEFWTSVCADGQLPQRADIDPLRMPTKLLPHILLIDVEAGATPRFRWRLLGTHITKVLGRDSTGKYIDDILPPELYDEFVEPLVWAIAKRRPVRVFGGAEHIGKDWVAYENYIAPLIDNTNSVNMIFGIALYGDAVTGLAGKTLTSFGGRN
jgi:hypothetical protein